MEYHNSKGLRIHYTSSAFKHMVTEFSSNWVSHRRIAMGSGASSTGATTLPWPSGYRVAVYPGTNRAVPPAQKDGHAFRAIPENHRAVSVFLHFHKVPCVLCAFFAPAGATLPEGFQIGAPVAASEKGLGFWRRNRVSREL